MKKIVLGALTLILSTTMFSSVYGQENLLSPLGNVGIGTLLPQHKMDVRGNLYVQDEVYIGDSLTVNGNLRINQASFFQGSSQFTTSRVLSQLIADGTSTFNGQVLFPNLPQASTLDSSSYFLITKADGTTQKVPHDTLINHTKSLVYAPLPATKQCIPNGPYSLNPTWFNGPHKIYIPCPDVSVGIGTSDPASKLDVRGTTYTNRLAINTDPSVTAMGTRYFHMEVPNTTDAYANATVFLIENSDRPLLQLNNNGILRSREVILNLDQSWPDYVFQPTYQLLPFNDLRTFITTNGHLPNVPTAQQVEQDGINVGEMNKVLVEKIEELTLYILELENRIKAIEATEKH